LTAATETFPDIPFFDLKVEQDDLDAVAETLRSGWLTAGPRTAEFERTFAEFVGARDEVIVPAYTFAATAAAAIYCGGTPVFADILGQHDLSIDPEDVERKITERTKAVCARCTSPATRRRSRV
jgi:perosamine synthetase